MLLHFLVLYMPFAVADLIPCQEYARINETYYNVTCLLACEKLEKNIYLLNCSELYNYSENFINQCYNKQECEYTMNEMHYDLNNLLNQMNCKNNILIPCNITEDKSTSIHWAIIIFLIFFSISLSICSIYHCRRLWIYYYNKRIENREVRLSTALINGN